MSAAGPLFELSEIEARLARFLARQGLAAVEIAKLRRFTVGFSWITFGFCASWRDSGGRRELILRLGPPNGIFAPYKASPEFLALRALQASGAPVPQVHWHSDSSEDFGAPFFICDFVRGEAPIPWTRDGGPAFDEATRKSLATQFLAALAAVHRFPWRGSALERIGGSTDVAIAAHNQIDAWQSLLRGWS